MFYLSGLTKETLNFIQAERITVINPSFLMFRLYKNDGLSTPHLRRVLEEIVSTPFPISLLVPSPDRRCLVIQNLNCCWNPFNTCLESRWVKGQFPLMINPLSLSTMSFMHAASAVKWLHLSLVSLLPLGVNHSLAQGLNDQVNKGPGCPDHLGFRHSAQKPFLTPVSFW